MQSHRTSHLILIAGLAAVLAGCGSAGAPSSASAPTASAPQAASTAAALATAAPQPTQAASAALGDDQQIRAVMAETLKLEGTLADEPFIIQQIDGGYARVYDDARGGTTYYFLKRTQSTWSVVGQVAGPVERLADLREQGFPDTMLRDLEGTPDSAPANDDMLAAVYAHLGRGPDEIKDTVTVENVQGSYARVALTPDMGDGLWLFLQKSSAGGWFVLAQASMTAAPNLSAAREKGVPEELLRDIEGTAMAGSAPTAQGSMPSNTEAPIWTRPLSLRAPAMQGDDISIVQHRLLDLGYSEVGTPDGIFGSATNSAVLDFQARSGLTIDGIVGEQTWNSLFSTQAIHAVT